MNKLAAYALFMSHRVGVALITIFGVATLVFFAMRLLPGNYADIFFAFASEDARAELSETFGLNKPLFTQYVLWLGQMLQGNFGNSLATGRPVIDEILQRLPATLELASVAMIMVLIFGIPLGAIAGMYSKSFLSQFGRHLSAVLMSIPVFVLGSLLLYVFSINDLWFKAGGWASVSEEGLLENIRHVALPAFTLMASAIGVVLATTRSGVITVLGMDHILAAVSRGVKARAIFNRHILRNTLIPVMTVYAIVLGNMLGGAVLVETVFNIDGIGRLIVNSVSTRDYPVVQLGVILTSTFFVVVNTIADILYGVIDPRISGSGTL